MQQIYTWERVNMHAHLCITKIFSYAFELLYLRVRREGWFIWQICIQEDPILASWRATIEQFGNFQLTQIQTPLLLYWAGRQGAWTDLKIIHVKENSKKRFCHYYIIVQLDHNLII